MMLRNVARRSTQRLRCACQLRVPLPPSRPRNRRDDFLNLRGLKKPRTIGSCLGQPAIIKETVKSRKRSAGGEQNRHGELDAKQSRPFKRLSGGSR
jgi:hypothetical protein